MVKSARRVIEILELFDEAQANLSVGDIAARLGYPQSSTSEILQALRSMGYLHYDARSRRFSPTLMVSLLGDWVHHKILGDLWITALTRELRAKTGGTVSLAVQFQIYAKYIRVLRPDGGAGASYVSFILALEQIVRTGYPAAFLFTMTCSGPIDYILRLGSEEVRRKYLPPLAAGEWLGAIGITEPDAGSDIGAIRTRARIEGDRVRINGAKLFVGGGGECEVYIVFVRMSDEPGVKGLGCVAVDRDAPGLKFGPKFRMMGSRPVPRSELIFEDCVIPVENVLARPGEFGRMMEIFNIERMHNACFGLGMALGAYEHALEYARERVQFGRPLIANQGIQWKLAEMQTVLEAARALIYKAAVAKDQGAERLGILTSQAKLFSAKHCPWVVDQAMQIEGAYGYSEGSRVERMYRDIRLVPIAAGTVEMMLNYLGRQLAH